MSHRSKLPNVRASKIFHRLSLMEVHRNPTSNHSTNSNCFFLQILNSPSARNWASCKRCPSTAIAWSHRRWQSVWCWWEARNWCTTPYCINNMALWPLREAAWSIPITKWCVWVSWLKLRRGLRAIIKRPPLLIFVCVRNFFETGIGRKLDVSRMFAIWRIPAPWQPITKKGQGMRMGGGKSAIDHYATPIKAGRIIIELAGRCEYAEVGIF